MKFRLAAAWVCLLLISSCVQSPKPTGIPTVQALTAAATVPMGVVTTGTPKPTPTTDAARLQAATATNSIPIQSSKTAAPTTSPSPVLSQNGLQLEKTFQYSPWALVHDLAWSPDGTWLAASAGENIYIYDGMTLEIAHSLKVGAWANEVQFLNSQHTTDWILGLAVSDGTLQFWDISQEKRLVMFTAHHKAANSLAISPDGRTAASSGNDAILRLWDLETIWAQVEEEITPSAEMIGGAFAVPAVRFSPDGSMIASIDLQAVRLRDPVTTRLVRTLRSEDSLFDIAFSPDGQFLAAASTGSSIQVWQVGTGESIAIWETGEEDAFLWSLAFDARGSRLCAASSLGAVYLWSFPEGELLSGSRLHHKAASAVAFSPDGKRLATGGLDAVVHILRLTP